MLARLADTALSLSIAVGALSFGVSTNVAQEPAAPPAPAAEAAPQPTPPATLRTRLGRTRLARSPEMFGDQLLSQPAYLETITYPGSDFELVALQGPAYVRGFSQKISENNHTLPRDRVFYTFNYFNDAFTMRQLFINGPVIDATNQFSLYRHTVGVEKTFFDGRCSIQVQTQFDGNAELSRFFNPDVFHFGGGEVGNSILVGKVLLVEQGGFALGGGLAVELPTGDDALWRVDDARLKFENESVFVSPFLAALWLPDDDWFVNAFLQVQAAANGNPVNYGNLGANTSQQLGVINPATAAMIDLAVGRWLYRSPNARIFTGLAMIFEVHQLAGLQDTDGLGFSSSDTIAAIPGGDRVSLTSLTLGLHTQLGARSSLRLAGVLPVDGAQFDSEIIVQLNIGY